MSTLDKAPAKRGTSPDMIVFYLGTAVSALLLIFMFVSFALGIWFGDSRWGSTGLLSAFAAAVVFFGGLGLAYFIDPKEQA